MVPSDGRRAMKVVHLINDLEIGGAQRVVEDLATGAVSCDASIITLHPVAQVIRHSLAARGVGVHSLRPLRPASTRTAKQWISSADVVHAHLFPSFYLAAGLDKPKIFTEHSMHNRRRDRAWARPLERRIYGRYDRIVCISQAARASLATWLGEPTGGLQVIGNGIDVERYAGRVRELPGSGLRLVMAGTFTRRKDQATLLRALSSLPKTVSLTLIGEGPRRASTQSLSRELGVGDRVEFRGAVARDDMPATLAEFDLYVQSSHFEAFGLAPLEAMACGIPALGTDLPGLDEVVGDSRLLFPPGDAGGLSRLILSILEDRSTYRSLSEQALARARRYDVATMVRDYEALYAEVLALRS